MKNSDIPRPKRYSQILPDMEEWPIVRLSKERDEFANDVLEHAASKLGSTNNLEDALTQTLFLETIRLKSQRWSTDSSDEKEFWKSVKERLLELALKTKEEQNEGEKKLLRGIIVRYVQEIEGRFSIRAYRWSQRILNVIFYPLLNAPVYLNFLEKKYSLQVEKRIHLSGEIDALRELSKNHTLLLVPTHFSNLDSITVGWAARSLGLPAFLYGAGLNLFGIKAFSFFMNRIGAYKVDRRKKNPIYLEVLKTYSSLAMQRGCHSMFFPYADRSLSGSIEQKLKLGLLGTAIEAQFQNMATAKQKGNDASYKKIIIVPVVLNYHFVLEAPFLIDEYLKSTGKANYLFDENDQFSNSWDLLKVGYKLFTKDTDFLISFGQCMDIFGNRVEADGRSMDHLGREVDSRDYFKSGNELKVDLQRDSEYARMLGHKIVESYMKENTVFSSHLVAYAAFEILKLKNPKADLFDLMRLPEDERIIPMNEFSDRINILLVQLRQKAENKELKVDSFIEKGLKGVPADIIEHGLNNLGIYHANDVLSRNKAGQIEAHDMKLLFYYHNRLSGYNLEKSV